MKASWKETNSTGEFEIEDIRCSSRIPQLDMTEWSLMIIKTLKAKVRNIDIIFFVVLGLMIFICKANILNLPYYWDEWGAYIVPAYRLAQGSLLRALPGLHPPYLFFGHPPALYLLLAVIYKLLGETIWIFHLLAISFSFLGVYFTYLLGTHLFNRNVGILAALFLFFSPLYFAQSGMVHADIVITAFGVMTVYFMLKNNYVAYLLSSIIMVMVKESSMVLIVALLIYIFIFEKDRSVVINKLFKYAIPLIVICIFFGFQKLATGSFLPNPYFNSHAFATFNHNALIHKMISGVGNWLFWEQYRIILTFIIIVNIIITLKNGIKKESYLFLIIITFYIIPFSFIFFLPRYILIAFPYFSILGACSIVMIFKGLKKQLAVVVVILALFIFELHGNDKRPGNFEKDMQYRDVVLTHMEACKYIEAKYPDKVILATWPISTALKAPLLGYVKRSIKVTTKMKDKYDIIVYSPQCTTGSERLKKKALKQNMLLDKIFEKNGKCVEIYVYIT